MLISESIARKKWCPLVRIENSNRVYNTKTDGFENTNLMHHCIADECMGWREFRLSHEKGTDIGQLEKHGYCGYAGRPELG